MAFDVAAETIEGTPPGPQTVILKFESTEAAKAWYESPAYQAVVGKRLAATKGFAVICPVHEHAGLIPSHPSPAPGRVMRRGVVRHTVTRGPRRFDANRG